jgi:peptidoglycan/xylan/chitin deacetylase (PgdA/CDA1 family)
LALNLEHFIYGEGGVDLDRTSPSPNLRSYLWREYGNRVGVWRLLDLFDELEFPLGVIANTAIYDHAPQIMAAHRARGDEVIGHGITNSKPLASMDEAEERALFQEVTERLTEEEGGPPQGWLSPYLAPSERTPDLLAEFGYSYILDFGMVDDQPFWCETAPIHKNKTEQLLCLPYPIELNDQPAMVFRRDGPDEFFASAIVQFDEMLRATEKYSQVFVVSLHSFIVGQPYRLKHLRRLLEHIKSHEADIWITKPGDIAAYYRGLSDD